MHVIRIRKAFSIEYYTGGGESAVGVESYYLGGVTQGEPPGVWLGKGAETLGLSGEVAAEHMSKLYNDYEHPLTGERIGHRPAVRKELAERIAERQAAEPDALPERLEAIAREVTASERSNTKGWDATFSVSKSITAVHTAAARGELTATREGDVESAEAFRAIRVEVESAIADANAAAIGVLESVATARTGGGSGAPMRWVKAEGGLTVASFFQHTNRSIDPHLHQHNVILNKVLCPDGKYRAIDGQDLLNQRFAASAVADRVAMERMARMGFDVRLNAEGTARELSVVPQALVDFLSTRMRQVTAEVAPMVARHIETTGRQPTAAELANMHTAAGYATRAAKEKRTEPVEERLDRLQAGLARETGYTLDGLGQVIRVYAEHGPIAGQEWSPSALLAEAIDAAATKQATWGWADLMLEIELRLPILGIDDDQVPVLLRALTETALKSADVVQVTGLNSGEYAAPSKTRYAATGTLVAEKELRNLALEHSGHALDPVELKAWLDENAPTLGADQRAVIEGIATTDAAISMVIGPAGSGKSFTAGTLAAAWHDQTQGAGRVVGLATSEVAANVLTDDGIDASRNIDLWLISQHALAAGSTDPTHTPWALTTQDVVMVDEASMVSTRHMDAIRRHVQAAGARIVLTGDPAQLAAVEAGGVMPLLDGHAPTYTLTEIRRFHEDWERAASLRLRDGDPDALVAYEKHGRLVEAADLDEAVTIAARSAVADRMDGKATVVVAATNDLAARIACQVRDQLIELGHVEPGGVFLGRDRNTGNVGDIVMCRRIDRRIGVTNRTQYRVLETRDDGGLLVQELPRPDQRTPVSPDPIEIPTGYVAADVQLGYAGTVYATQGVTVDRGHRVTTGADPGYVPMTRGRERNTAIVALGVSGYDDGETGPQAKTAKGGLVRVEATTDRPVRPAERAAAGRHGRARRDGGRRT
jgi:conjugative relaxase-like TrwC/TraI family protein